MRLTMMACALLAAVACDQAPQDSPPAAAAPVSGRLVAPEKVADRVWVMRQPDRLWSAVIGNVAIVEQSDGVVLVDSGGTIADGRDVLAAVARLTSKPVKAVVLTHWHNDHPLGVPAVLERFPDARIIATQITARLMADPDVIGNGIGRPDLARQQERLKGAEERAAAYLASARDPSLTQAVRAEYATEAAWVLERARRQLGNYTVLPTETFTGRLVIADPEVPIEILHLGRANTEGDAFVWLPRQRIIAAGDAVVLPTPYGFSSPIDPWLATLARLEAYDFAVLIPGHGPVQRDRDYLATLRWSMEDIRRQARSLSAGTEPPDAAAKRFDRTEQRRRFAARDAWSQRWLDEYWLDGMTQTAIKEARGIPAGSELD